MYPISGFIIFSLIITVGYFVGLLVFVTDYEKDQCEMTYMFEYPQYIRISHHIDRKYKKYRLFAYSEGRFTFKARNMYFDGIPVLFVIGNAGSHKQVRSLASVALRMAINQGSSYHFDYFAVDFNKEYNGIYGALLNDQLSYVNSSIFRILDLYKDRKNPPKSVVLIGHSVGGVLVKKFVSTLPIDSDLIPILLNLAAPLKNLPIILDRHMNDFYKMPSTMPTSTTEVSISGGFSDLLIPTYLSSTGNNNSINVVTSNIPLSWVDAHHVQILWCKRTILAINRALFDSVDLKTKKISTDPSYLMNVFHHHLVHHSGTKASQKSYYEEETFHIDYKKDYEAKSEWIESLLKQYSVHHANGVRKPHWYMLSLTSLPDYEMLTVLAINLEVVDWIFACNTVIPRGASKVCNSAVHLTQISEIVPSARFKRRMATVNMHELQENNTELSHIIFRVLPTKGPVTFHVDIYGSQSRRIKIDLPKWWTFGKKVIIPETTEKALRYDLELPELTHIVQLYHFFVEPVSCSKDMHHATASLLTAWNNNGHHKHFTETENKPLNVRLHTSRPTNANSAKIRLILDPTCTYKLSIKFSLLGTLGQMARHYSPLLLTNFAVVVLLTLNAQLKNISTTGQCSIFFIAVKQGAKPFYVLIVVEIISKLFSFGYSPTFLPKPDTLYLSEDIGMDFLLPILLYMCSVGIAWILAILFCISLVTLESTVNKLALKLLAKTVSFTVSWSEYLMSFLHKVPFIVAATLIFLCISTCGGLALCLGVIFYFLKLTQMSQDYIEEVVWFIVRKLAKKIKLALRKEKKDLTNNKKTDDKRSSCDSKNLNESNEQLVVKNFLDRPECSNNQEAKTSDQAQENETEDVNKQIEDSDDQNEEQLKETMENDQSEVKTQNEEEEIEDKKHKETDKSKQEHIKDPERNNQIKLEKQTEDEKTSKENDQSKLEKDSKALDSLCKTSLNKKDQTENVTEHYKVEPYKRTYELLTVHNSIFFHSTLFFLWCIITVINVPAVITWAHNFRYSTFLSPDDSFIPGLALSVCALPLWQLDFPKTNRKYFKELQSVITLISIVSLMFATISVYRLNYLLTLTIVLVVLHQLFAPKIDQNGSGASDETDNSDKKKQKHTKYEDIKMKWE